jgi:hypothetical protein
MYITNTFNTLISTTNVFSDNIMQEFSYDSNLYENIKIQNIFFKPIFGLKWYCNYKFLKLNMVK